MPLPPNRDIIEVSEQLREIRLLKKDVLQEEMVKTLITSYLFQKGVKTLNQMNAWSPQDRIDLFQEIQTALLKAKEVSESDDGY